MTLPSFFFFFFGHRRPSRRVCEFPSSRYYQPLPGGTSTLEDSPDRSIHPSIHRAAFFGSTNFRAAASAGSRECTPPPQFTPGLSRDFLLLTPLVCVCCVVPAAPYAGEGPGRRAPVPDRQGLSSSGAQGAAAEAPGHARPERSGEGWRRAHTRHVSTAEKSATRPRMSGTRIPTPMSKFTSVLCTHR